MSRNLRDPKAGHPGGQEQPGLDPVELRAERADDLPERDAMSVVGVGDLEIGLPPAGLLDGVLDTDMPVQRQPLELPAEGDSASVPDPRDASADASVEV